MKAFGNFRLFIPYVNNRELLDKCLSTASNFNPIIIDNSAGEELSELKEDVMGPPVPLSASQSINYAMLWTRDLGASACLLMHSDAYATEDQFCALIKFLVAVEGRKWGAIFTNYDALVALNPKALEDVGLWDTTFPQYFSDNDYYYRLKLAGYELINTGIPVEHYGSATIRSSEERATHNSRTFDLYRDYYIRKWGGQPGEEKFTSPFNQ